MSGQNRQISKLCLTGFILSIVSPVVLILSLLMTLAGPVAYAVTLLLAAALPLVGLILSIVGVATAGKAGKKGKGFGIAGIVLPIVYAILTVAFICFLGVMTFGNIKKDMEEQKLNEFYDMDGVYPPRTNTEYDISQYMLMQGYMSDSTVTSEDLDSFAGERLDEVTREDDTRIRGTYRGYEFIIVRSDSFDTWLEDSAGTLSYTEEGYATIEYEADWEFTTFRVHTLDVYTDPSGQFIVVTNCDDNKVITEFFE